MAKWIARALPLFWSCVALAQETKDAPMPTEMNWTGVIAFAVVFFGLSAGFIFAVWRSSRKKKEDKS